jgi:hypothetical protein
MSLLASSCRRCFSGGAFPRQRRHPPCRSTVPTCIMIPNGYLLINRGWRPFLPETVGGGLSAAITDLPRVRLGAEQEEASVAHDFCLAVGMFGVGFLICGIRLGIFARRDRKVAKAYLARCRAWGLKTEHFSRDSINNLTLAERDLIALRHDVEQLQTLAFAEHEAQLRADGATVLDEPSVIALRKEAADGAAC